MFRIFLSVIFILGIIVHAFAQDTYASVDTISISEIKVSAALFEGELMTIPASVSILTNEQLGQQDELSIVNHLNTVPGIYMQAGTFNTNRIVIRGIGSRTPYSSNRIKAYLNEIPLSNGDGITTLEDIDVNRLGRIEVIKGPTSALYGAGLGGTIKLSTNRLVKPFTSTYQFASFNTHKLNISTGIKVPHGNFTGSFHRTHSDGFRENNQYNRNSIFLSADKQVKSISLNFTLMMVDMNAQIPSSLNFDSFQNSPQAAALNWLEAKGFEENIKVISGITVNQRLSKNTSNKTTLFYSYNNAFEHRPFNDLDDVSKSYGARNQFFLHKNNWGFIAGFELFSENYSWAIRNSENEEIKTHTDISENRSYGNLFCFFNYHAIENLKISAGANMNRLSYEYSSLQNEIGNFSYPFILSPRLGLNYSISEQIHFYGSLGHGFSSPSLEETLRPNGKKNPDLKQEQGLMEELGTRFTLISNRLFVDIVAYQISLKNLLVTKRITEDIFTGINAGKSTHKGFELQTRYIVLDRIDFPGKLIANASYSFSNNRFIHFIDDGNDFSGQYLPGIPKHTFYSGILWIPTNRLKIHFNYRNVGEQFLSDDNIGKTQIYQVFDSKVSYNLSFKNKFNISVSGGVNNILDAHYASMVLINAPSFGEAKPRYYYPGKPRNIYIGLGIRF